MARNDVYLNINALSPADAVVTGQQDMTAATVPELVLGDTPTFNFYFTDNTNVWPSWAGNASYSLTWALSDAVAGDFSPAATTGNATPITGGWSVLLPLNSYDLVGLLNTKRVGQPYPVTNLWQQLRVTDPSGNEVTRAMFWTPVRYRAISDTQNTESASPTGGRFVTVNNVNTLTTPTAAQFYSANPVPTSALGTAANGELLIGNGTGFTKSTLTAGTGITVTNGSGSITISATDGDITLDDGTAAAPSLKFTADTDTGIYRPSDNVLGISAGGVSRATFGATSAINGTTIPGSKTLVVTTDKLSALAATTSAELAGVISDETGTGALVFANTPTLVTPNIGAATGTSVNLSGAGTFGGNLTVNGTGTSSVAGSFDVTGAIRHVGAGGGIVGIFSSSTVGIINSVGGGGLVIRGRSGTNNDVTISNSDGSVTLLSNLTVSGGQIAIAASSSTPSVLVTQTDPAAYSLFRLRNTGGTAQSYDFAVGGSGTGSLAQKFYVYDGTAGAVRLAIAPTTGNLLVGTTTDGGQKLQVAGSAILLTAEPILNLSSTAASSIAYQLIAGGGSGHTTGTFKIYDSSLGYTVLSHAKGTYGPSVRLGFDTGGNATFGGDYVYIGGGSNFYLRATGSGNGLWYGNNVSVDANYFNVRNQAGSTSYLSVDSTGATFAGSVKATTKLTVGSAASSPSIYGSSTVTVGTSAVDLLSTSLNTGAIAVVSGYNNSGGQQGVWLIIATGGGLISTVASQNATGLTPTFSISTGKLQMSLASGSMSVVTTILGVTGL